jgi:hypothetical protein
VNTSPICHRGEPLGVIKELDSVRVTAEPKAPPPGYVGVVAKRHAEEPYQLSGKERVLFLNEAMRVAEADHRLWSAQPVDRSEPERRLRVRPSPGRPRLLCGRARTIWVLRSERAFWRGSRMRRGRGSQICVGVRSLLLPGLIESVTRFSRTRTVVLVGSGARLPVRCSQEQALATDASRTSWRGRLGLIWGVRWRADGCAQVESSR